MADFPSVIPYGTTPPGEVVSLITLGNSDVSCQILTYGVTLRQAGQVTSERSGITLRVSTTLPAVHLYTANTLAAGHPGKMAVLIERIMS